ncbi:hypothetical protein [Wolbachia endosymbiont (group B) of Horisme vitalbata]|uniref:hypothetical protein n=1 Tax=Wolbachia endosymbiont (group B) of Horisme vitalbata TaxID=3066178 RepID=UPI0033400062
MDTVCIVFSEFVVGALVGIVVIIVACEVAIVSATVVGSDDVLILVVNSVKGLLIVVLLAVKVDSTVAAVDFTVLVSEPVLKGNEEKSMMR